MLVFSWLVGQTRRLTSKPIKPFLERKFKTDKITLMAGKMPDNSGENLQWTMTNQPFSRVVQIPAAGPPIASKSRGCTAVSGLVMCG